MTSETEVSTTNLVMIGLVIFMICGMFGAVYMFGQNNSPYDDYMASMERPTQMTITYNHAGLTTHENGTVPWETCVKLMKVFAQVNTYDPTDEFFANRTISCEEKDD